MKSQKFLALLLVETGLFALLLVMLFQPDVNAVGGNVAFVAISITVGVLATGYILGQAALERHIEVARITTGRLHTAADGTMDARQSANTRADSSALVAAGAHADSGSSPLEDASAAEK